MDDQEWQAHQEKREAERQYEEMVRTHVCAECGSGLITPWDSNQNALILVCSRDRSHQGYAKPASWTELRQQGFAIPLDIANQIDKRERRMK